MLVHLLLLLQLPVSPRRPAEQLPLRHDCVLDTGKATTNSASFSSCAAPLPRNRLFEYLEDGTCVEASVLSRTFQFCPFLRRLLAVSGPGWPTVQEDVIGGNCSRTFVSEDAEAQSQVLKQDSFKLGGFKHERCQLQNRAFAGKRRGELRENR